MTDYCYDGDCRVLLPTFEAESVDAVVTDPPYHLTTGKKGGRGLASVNLDSPAGRSLVTTGFMGMKWDGGGVAFEPATWAAMLRVMKPGAYLVAFGGTRTYHRLACAIEDAGFEIRDQLAWVYGSGFPKGTDKAKIPDEWKGWNTALKPAWEPIVLARKPMIGTLAENLQRYGCGALNVDGCRVAGTPGSGVWGTSNESVNPDRMFNASPEGSSYRSEAKEVGDGLVGRWPANLMHDGSDEVLEHFPAEAGAFAPVRGTEPSRPAKNVYGEFKRGGGAFHGDAGSAARFFQSISITDEEWVCMLLGIVPTATGSFFLPSLLAAIARSDAATSALPAGTQLSALPARSTNVTASDSRMLCEAVITAMLSLGQRFLRAWQRERLSPNGSRANVVATRELTGTMTIMASHWRFDGSADPVTFVITPNSEVPGEVDWRFSYCPKADRDDREHGLHDREKKPLLWSSGTQNPGAFQSPNTDRSARNHHPTVKPTDLMRWLVRLVTPPGGLVLDPFMGSGSTGRGALLERCEFVGIESDAEYVEIAKARIAAVDPESFSLTAQSR